MRDFSGQTDQTLIGRETGASTRRPLRIGIVGCGRVGETCHLPALRSLGRGFEVVAVADVDEHRRRRVSGMFGIARTFADVDAMLADPASADAIEVIAVCTPAAAHADAVELALKAQKHILLEKPIALTLDDADRIVERAGAFPHLKVMLGFNLRHHRLVRQARQLIQRGLLGQIVLARTVWTSGIRHRLQLPAWRDRRESGGGVLAEIAVHHVDLLRHLTAAEVEQVFAVTHHGDGDDQTAALTLRLAGGAAASCVFSDCAADSNEVEIIGTDARLSFSIYRFDSLSFTPTGSYGGRGRHLVQTLKELPQVVPILRRGGDFRETYRQEWLALRAAIREDAPVSATPADGRAALRIVLAAGASANAGEALSVASAPRRPVPVPAGAARERGEEASSEPADDGVDRPQLSAIITTRGRFDSIRRTVRHLRAQTARDRIELVIVCPDQRALALDAAAVEGFWGHRVVEVRSIASAARANAAGVRAASARLVALCEDHAFPEPGWAAALILAHRGPYAAVGPVVRNANPGTMISWADCLIGYGPWLAPLAPCEPAHLPGHNSSYKRDVLLAYGQRLDEMMEAETVLQWDLRAQGKRLYLDPNAVTAHTNFAQLGVWTKVQFHAGRMFAATRAIGWPLWKRLVFTGGSPLIPLVRFRRIWGQARHVQAEHKVLPAVIPALLWGLAMDALGQMAGYATAAGRSRARVADYEFERVRYVTEQDRAALSDADAPASAPQVQLEQSRA